MSRRFFLACYTWYTVLLVVIVCDDYKGFDDTVLFKINWPGADTIQLVRTMNLEKQMLPRTLTKIKPKTN